MQEKEGFRVPYDLPHMRTTDTKFYKWRMFFFGLLTLVHKAPTIATYNTRLLPRGFFTPGSDSTCNNLEIISLMATCGLPATIFLLLTSDSSRWYVSAHSGVTPYSPTSKERKALRVWLTSPWPTASLMAKIPKETLITQGSRLTGHSGPQWCRAT